MAANPDMKVKIGVDDDLLDYLRSAQAQVKQFDNTVKRSGSVVQAYGSEHSAMTKRFKFFRGAAQQAGYQIGDYAVQIANGTSKMQAFGQQGSQLLGIFGPIGAILGAGVAIFSAVAVAAEKSATGAKNAKDAMELLKNQASSLSAAMDILRMSTDEMAKSYGRGADSVRAFATVQAELLIAQTKRIISDQIEVANDAVKQYTAYENTMLSSGQMLSKALANIKNDFGLTGSAAMEFQRTLVELRDAEFGDEQTAALQKVLSAVKDLGIPMEKIPSDLNEALQKMIQLNQETAYLKTLMAEVAAETQNMNTGLPLFAQGFTPEGLLPPDKPIKAPKRGGAKKEDPMKRLLERLSLQERLIGKTQEEQQVLQALGADYEKYSQSSINAAISRIKEINSMTAALEEARQRTQDIANTIQGSMTSAFMSIVDGTKSAKEAFKDMARSIIAKLYEVLVVQRLVGQFNAATGQGTGIVGAIMGAFGKRATGGPITAGKPYMVGEKGPELVVPSRNGNVVPNNQLSGGGVTVIQNNTFGQGVSRAEINAMLPKIVETTKAAVFDAQRRSVGGRGYA